MYETCEKCDGEGVIPCCDNSGQCEAPKGARDITNCVHCGKELREKNGEWFTWDADMTPYPRSQGPVV